MGIGNRPGRRPRQPSGRFRVPVTGRCFNSVGLEQPTGTRLPRRARRHVLHRNGNPPASGRRADQGLGTASDPSESWRAPGRHSLV